MEQTWPWSDRRCFNLSAAPDEGSAQLTAEDEQHLVRVLRARVGERILGLDGRGCAWPLSVTAVSRDEVRLEPDGEPYREPPPGEPGSRIGQVELAVAWPRPQVGEELLDGLVQLGCARVVALVTERSQEWGREWNAARRARLERASREACKQARRLWPIELSGPVSFEEWLSSAEFAPEKTVALEPRAATSLEEFTRRARALPGRIVVAIGPEGGWSPSELQALAERRVELASLRTCVLRTELAAQAAAAIALH